MTCRRGKKTRPDVRRSKTDRVVDSPALRRNCVVCGKEFIANGLSPWYRFDSKKCANDWHGPRRGPRRRDRAADCERAKEWYRANPEKAKEKAKRGRHVRRAREKAARVENVNYERIKVRDRMRCHLCRRKVAAADVEFDHVIPIARGGAHTEANIAVAHKSCNRRKGAKIVTLF